MQPFLSRLVFTAIGSVCGGLVIATILVLRIPPFVADMADSALTSEPLPSFALVWLICLSLAVSLGDGFRKIVTPALRPAQWHKSRKKIVAPGRKEIVTVIVTDITHFSWITEQIEPDILWGLMADYFEKLARIINSYNGEIITITGDGIVALFRRRVLSDSTAAACAAAAVMLRRIRQLNRCHIQRGALPLVTRIGIEQGEVAAGSLACSGSQQDQQLQLVLGDTINTAHRIQDYGKKVSGGSTILVSHNVLQMLDLNDRKFRANPLGSQVFRGKTEPVTIYQIVTPTQNAGPFEV